MLNTGGGGIQTLTREVQVHYGKGPRRVSPFFIPMFAPNMAACSGLDHLRHSGTGHGVGRGLRRGMPRPSSMLGAC